MSIDMLASAMFCMARNRLVLKDLVRKLPEMATMFSVLGIGLFPEFEEVKMDASGPGNYQYVARPPDRSNTAPVVKLFCGDTIHAIMFAASSTCRNLLRGILDSM